MSLLRQYRDRDRATSHSLQRMQALHLEIYIRAGGKGKRSAALLSVAITEESSSNPVVTAAEARSRGRARLEPILFLRRAVRRSFVRLPRVRTRVAGRAGVRRALRLAFAGRPIRRFALASGLGIDLTASRRWCGAGGRRRRLRCRGRCVCSGCYSRADKQCACHAGQGDDSVFSKHNKSSGCF